MSTATKFKYWLKMIIIIVLTASFTAWLKMLFPKLSIGYWPLWSNESFRNKIGIIIGIPLYELFYLGKFYILFVFIYAIISRKWQAIHYSQGLLSLLGMLISGVIYLVYKLNFYLESTHSYNIHKGAYPSKPWYTWVSYPEDIELLGIYAASGLLGGWLYYRLINRQQLFPN